MSFFNITDREARKEMMEDCLALKKKIKDENLEERNKGLHYQQYLEEQYEPVVTSTKNMTQSLDSIVHEQCKKLSPYFLPFYFPLFTFYFPLPTFLITS